MPAVFLQESLDPDELDSLQKEFPHYDFIEEPDWPNVEILYGSSLSEEELAAAPRLRWIHLPTADPSHLCLETLGGAPTEVLITQTKGQNIPQIAEFVIGGILAFSKQFFHWKEAPHEPEEFWDWPLKETMWTLSGKTLVQIGLGEVGTAIVQRANALKMRTWGVRIQRSFHPYCQKTFSIGELHAILPAANVVVLALPRTAGGKPLFGKEELELMPKDSMLIVVGSADSLDEAALAEVGKTGKFRGVLLDAYRSPPPAKNSPLREIPGVILTPSVASYPISPEHTAFRLFRTNLRHFTAGKLSEMANLLSLSVLR